MKDQYVLLHFSGYEDFQRTVPEGFRTLALEVGDESLICGNRATSACSNGGNPLCEVGLETKMDAVLTERYLNGVRQCSKVIFPPVTYSSEMCQSPHEACNLPQGDRPTWWT